MTQLAKLRELLEAAKADISYEILDYVPELLAVVEAANFLLQDAKVKDGTCRQYVIHADDIIRAQDALEALSSKLNLLDSGKPGDDVNDNEQE